MASKGNGSNGGNGVSKAEQNANAIRKAGGTIAIICHSLGVSYGQATLWAAAYDKKVGHAPSKLIRKASDMKLDLPGVTLKDGAGTKAAAPKAKKTAKGKKAAVKKSATKVTRKSAAKAAAGVDGNGGKKDRPVARPVATPAPASA